MQKIAILIIDFYKLFISNLFRPILGEGCRFNPTCSQYAKEAIEKKGVIQGSRLALERIAKCH
ncbi:hypothetical protein A2614_00810 [Candidatus Woesebacteria bacterium RIFOXYD1_FULL_40_21]|uniref:Membrane protein insertion efficiency factor YidD n=1 Tax=Candidatus Woesebacteria bacterium RIFOXYD1_FULL_40_21 TaxID=1802549 RepID=A0A1F8DF65_9BACT|nr:MAG: hypothetical protein A2614_00810 [Candidatus Woesebacteria bacterium RIFOXYD1_FULL_40_21]